MGGLDGNFYSEGGDGGCNVSGGGDGKGWVRYCWAWLRQEWWEWGSHLKRRGSEDVSWIPKSIWPSNCEQNWSVGVCIILPSGHFVCNSHWPRLH